MIRHFSLKHGSWLNQVEIEISIFERGCLSRPVAETQTLERRLGALEAESRATQIHASLFDPPQCLSLRR